MPGEPVTANRIVASSIWAVAAMVRAWGGEPVTLGIARDDVATIAGRIAEAAHSDLLVTLGGASVGEHDLIQDALKAEGFALDFWRIAMRPGKPLMFAERQHPRGASSKVLGMPGNPVSTLVCSLLFLKPAIERLLGLPGAMVLTRPGILGSDMAANDTRQDYVRAALDGLVDGVPKVRPFPVQDSSMLSVLAQADALLVRPAHDPARRAGEAVEVIVLADNAFAC
jgi:molybdopterin molybdotransferase